MIHWKLHSQDWKEAFGVLVRYMCRFKILIEFLNCVCSNKIPGSYVDFELASN